ncbi:MAG TPA: subclass B3 metallo-beta-lactamase [Sphingomicrobium sp.]|nr:subclass B3 metallo-beta-lactamase [Sphingomicrobium sp.]
MFASLIAASAIAVTGPADMAEWHAACDGKTEGFSDPAPPLHIFGNVYDVGTCEITVLLITSPKGHIMLDGATQEAAPSIAANIERLGFRLKDIKRIGFTHEHFDHAGGIAELQRRSGAIVMSMPPAYLALSSGQPEKRDPQYGALKPYPPANVGVMLSNGFVVQQGPLRLVAWATPGHAPGSTSWSWRSCENGRCANIVYADSVTAISSDAYRFSDHAQYVRAFRSSLGLIGNLGCGLLITPHPSASNLIDRLDGKVPLIAPGQCRAYAARGRAALEQRLAKEKHPSAGE